MTSLDYRVLTPADLAALDVYLMSDPDLTLFQRSNLLAKGLVDDGTRYSGTYVGAFDGERMVGMAVQAWNGNILVHAPTDAGTMAAATAKASGRAVQGVLGANAQVRAAIAALELTTAVQMDSVEVRFGLALEDLLVPAALRDDLVVARRAETRDVDTLAVWRVAYQVEALHQAPRDDAVSVARTRISEQLPEGATWVLEVDGTLVSTTSFNARVPDIVQVGGVFTPPELRSRGYAQAAVAGSLRAVRAAGVTRSVLFTDEHNVPAQRAYEAIGYERTGDFGIVIFEAPKA